jgi:hypothetical protein
LLQGKEDRHAAAGLANNTRKSLAGKRRIEKPTLEQTFHIQQENEEALEN